MVHLSGAALPQFYNVIDGQRAPTVNEFEVYESVRFLIKKIDKQRVGVHVSDALNRFVHFIGDQPCDCQCSLQMSCRDNATSRPGDCRCKSCVFVCLHVFLILVHRITKKNMEKK